MKRDPLTTDAVISQHVEVHEALVLANVGGVVGGAEQGVLVVAAWVLSGVVAAVVLVRRGHDLSSLLGLAVVLGPLFIGLGRALARRRDRTRPIVLVDGHARPGRRVHVVLLGASEAVADALPLLRELGAGGSVDLVALIDYESAQRHEWDVSKQEAQRRLRAAAVLLHEFAPGQVLAAGRVDAAVRSLRPAPTDLVLLVGEPTTTDAARVSDAARVPVVSLPTSEAP